MKRLLFSGLVCFSLVIAFSVYSFSAIPSQINHQGVIKISGIAYDGAGDFNFAFVDGSTGNNLWTNDGSQLGTNNQPASAVTLAVTQGLYSVNLGDTGLTNMVAIPSTVFNTDDVKLRIWFDGGSGAVQFSPDLPMVSAPYSFSAANSDFLGGITASEYSTDAELASGLAEKSDATHTHALENLLGTEVALINLSATPALTEDRLYQQNDSLYWQGQLISEEPTDVSVNPNSNGDFLINADTIIHNSLGVGYDAVTGMDFQYDTIVLRENNARLLFDDTSSSGSFPRTDWRLQANDSNNGGRSYFGLIDATNNTMPFYVGEAAPDSSLVVRRDTGYVGIHNARPEGLLDVLIRGAAEVADENSVGGELITGGAVAQSITAVTSGVLDSVVVYMNSIDPGVSSLGLKFYSGNDPSTGTLLNSLSLTTLPAFPASIRFDFSTLASPLHINSGSQYVIEIDAFYPDGVVAQGSTSNPYPGGQVYTKSYSTFPYAYTAVSGSDILFETYIQAESGFAPGLFVSSEGLVGINTKTPQEALDIAGAALIEASPSAPADTSDRLYNLGGNLYWDGRVIDTIPGIELNKNLIQNTGTLGFDWQDDEVADDITVSNYLPLDGGAVVGSITATAFYGDGSNLTGIVTGLSTSAAQYVIVQLSEGNSDTENASALQTAYATAKTLSPAASNRVAVIVPPGRYDLGTGSVMMDTPYIDLVGLTTNRKAQYIYGVSNGPNSGVLMQSADNVRIENLTVECTRSAGGLSFDETDPAAYWPGTNLPNTEVRNCEFIANDTSATPTRIYIEYSGTYVDCSGTDRAFGAYGTASGNFINCTVGNYGFAVSGIASGTFKNCSGGTSSFAAYGTASGAFVDCTGGDLAFGGGPSGSASGSFKNCTGGDNSFGGGGGTAAGGVFYYCNGNGPNAWAFDAGTTLYCIKNGASL